LTPTEWELLRPALVALPPEQLENIRRKMDAVAGQNAAPVVCPLLYEASGACPVYAQRPVACRTYGFYVQRGIGLYCQEIKSGVDRGELAEVVWGNQDAIDRSLADSGETRALDAWFAREL
jgi:Fe-S-cluster containining protein